MLSLTAPFPLELLRCIFVCGSTHVRTASEMQQKCNIRTLQIHIILAGKKTCLACPTCLKAPEGSKRCRHPGHVSAILWECCGKLCCDECFWNAPQEREDDKTNDGQERACCPHSILMCVRVCVGVRSEQGSVFEFMSGSAKLDMICLRE